MNDTDLLQENVVKLLIKASGTTSPSADNSKSWQFSAENDKLIIKEEKKNERGFSDVQGFLSSFAIGCVTEGTLEQAKYMGLSLDIDYQIAEGAFAPIVGIGLNRSQFKDIQKMDFSPVLQNRHTERTLKYLQPKKLPNAEQLSLDITKFNCSLVSFDQSDKVGLNKLAKLAGIAEEMRFQNKSIHHEMMSSIDFDNKYNGSKYLNVKSLKLDVPTEFALRHIVRKWPVLNLLNQVGIYKMLGIKGAREPISTAPYVLCLSANSYSKDDLYNCGRALMRTWLTLTSQGYVIQPYAAIGTMSSNHFQFSDTSLEKKRLNLSSNLQSFLNSDAPCMLIRVGALAKK